MVWRVEVHALALLLCPLQHLVAVPKAQGIAQQRQYPVVLQARLTRGQVHYESAEGPQAARPFNGPCLWQREEEVELVRVANTGQP